MGPDCYVEESLLVVRGLGIQTSSSSATYLSTATTRFIPTTQIQDIVIHEAFKGLEVRFYLAVAVEGEPNVVVVFPVGMQRPQWRLYAYEFDDRNCSQDERYWKMSGEAPDIAFMMRSPDILADETIYELYKVKSACLAER